MNWSVGDRVKYPRMQDKWGKGEVRVVSPDGKLTIYFAMGGERRLARDAELEKLDGEDARDETLDAVRPRKNKAKTASGLTPSIELLKSDFIRRFPRGFEDPEFLERERDYKVDAHERLKETLGRAAMKTMIHDGQHEELRARARSVIAKTNIIDHHETIGLDKSTRQAKNAEVYARGLFDVLYGTDDFKTRFERFMEVLTRLDGSTWTVATYFPFIAFPAEHMFLKPVATQYVARACGFELNYRPEPNWLTYESLLRLVDVLKDKLADLNPKDNIDLQSFIWFVWKKDEYVGRIAPTNE